MRKPRVTTNPVANRYSSPNERIVEYSAGESGAGGLISLTVTEDGRLHVHLYRHDALVTISVADPPTDSNGVDLGAPLVQS